MSSPPPLLGALLHDATRLVGKQFAVRAAAYGLSSAQWRLLVHVLREGPVSQARLADWLEIEPISVSRLIDRMQKSGWVMRQPDPQDRRVQLIVATEATLAIRHELKAMATAVYDEAMAGLDPAARATLLSGLSSVIATVSTTLSVGTALVCDPDCQTHPSDLKDPT